ncbi:MAG: 16S rRNA processing protein RimM [Bacilli bacterium]|nr:16S rRNA processing protein RimM [Bacilli bacterium]
MKYINVGKYVNTHGLKGEIRILSNFRHKKNVFTKGMKLYIGKDKKEFTINTYRFHKIYDMVTFNDINNINDIEYLKGSQVFINEDDLILDNGIYSGKLIDFKVISDNKEIGIITEIIDTPANEVLRVGDKILIPYVDEFIENIDIDNKTIYVKSGGIV